MAGAVHRLQGVHRLFACVLFVDFDDKHVFLVLFPVAGLFPQLAIHNLRCVDFNVAARALFAAHIVL